MNICQTLFDWLIVAVGIKNYQKKEIKIPREGLRRSMECNMQPIVSPLAQPFIPKIAGSTEVLLHK